MLRMMSDLLCCASLRPDEGPAGIRLEKGNGRSSDLHTGEPSGPDAEPGPGGGGQQKLGLLLQEMQI